MITLEDVRDYVHQVLLGFRNDPPDSEHQEGFEAAYKELQEFMNR